MYLENKGTLEIESSAPGHPSRGALAGNFGELRLLQGFSREAQKLQQAAAPPPGHCVIHEEGLVPVHQEDG